MIYIIKAIRNLGGGYDNPDNYNYQVISHHSVITQEQLDKYFNYRDKVLVEDVNRIRYIQMWANTYNDKGDPINIITYNPCVRVVDTNEHVADKIKVFDEIISKYMSDLRSNKLEKLGV